MITLPQCLQIFLPLIYFPEVGNCLDWEVVDKVIDYGQNVSLFCKINNCCQRNSGWDIFDPTKRTLWLDVRDVDIDSEAKYVPFTSTEGFGLTIRNITKDDLGNRYRCMYGLDEGEPKMLTESLTFKGPEWIVLNQVVQYGENLTLFCHKEGCCAKVFEWIIYKTEQIEIHPNDNDTLNKKYIVRQTKNGFSLIIMKFAEEDLNISYACRYGKRLGDSKLLSEDDAFKVDKGRKAKDTRTIGTFAIIILALVPSIVVIATCYLIMKKTRKHLFTDFIRQIKNLFCSEKTNGDSFISGRESNASYNSEDILQSGETVLKRTDDESSISSPKRSVSDTSAGKLQMEKSVAERTDDDHCAGCDGI